MNRDPRSVMHEAALWQALLAAVSELNDGIFSAANAIAALPVSLLELLLSPDPKAASDEAQCKIRAAMGSVQAMQAPIDRLIELSTGRLIALRAEAGLEPNEEEL